MKEWYQQTKEEILSQVQVTEQGQMCIRDRSYTFPVEEGGHGRRFHGFWHGAGKRGNHHRWNDI